jgi:hypothetical protein
MLDIAGRYFTSIPVGLRGAKGKTDAALAFWFGAELLGGRDKADLALIIASLAHSR